MTTLTPDGHAPARSDAPTRRAAVVTAVVGLALGVVELCLGLWAWLATDEAARTSDDPLVGIGYLVALVVAVPGAVGVALAGLGWLLARRRSAWLSRSSAWSSPRRHWCSGCGCSRRRSEGVTRARVVAKMGAWRHRTRPASSAPRPRSTHRPSTSGRS